MIGPSCAALWGFRLVVLLPLTAACTPFTPHVDRLDPCLGVPTSVLVPTYCQNDSKSGGGGSLSLPVREGGVTPPKPDPAPQPKPEPSPEPSPKPEPDHDDHDDHYEGPDLDRDYDDDDNDDHDDWAKHDDD